MPFKSKAQERFAYATGQPWAHEWSEHTSAKRRKKMPERITKNDDLTQYSLVELSKAVGHDVVKALPRALRDVPRPTASTLKANNAGTPLHHPRPFKRSDFPHTPVSDVPGLQRKNVEAGYMASRLNAHYAGRDRAWRTAGGMYNPASRSKRSMARETSRKRLVELAAMSKALPPPHAVTPWDQARINRGKKRQKRLSEASAVLGLTALAATAPKAARHVARRLPNVSNSRALKAIARAEPKANAVTNAAVPLTLGTGAAGSINFAHQQGLEVKSSKPVTASKGLIYATPKKAKKANTVGNLADFKTHARAERKFRHGGRMGEGVNKAWREHVSPAANNAYVDLGQRKQARYNDAAAQAVTSGVAGAAMYHGSRRFGHTKPVAGVLAAPIAAYPAWAAVNRVKNARSLEGRRRKIKAKGREREAAYVPDPKWAARDGKRLDREGRLIGKALVPIPRSKAIMPIKPRVGGLMRMPSGKVVTRRGAIVGTNPLRRI
jgi:hypothetical protein